MINCTIITDFCCLANDNAHTMVNKNTTAKFGAWMNLNASEDPPQV